MAHEQNVTDFFIDKKGNTKTYRIKEGVRFKPLEYLVDDFDLDILEEVK